MHTVWLDIVHSGSLVDCHNYLAMNILFFCTGNSADMWCRNSSKQTTRSDCVGGGLLVPSHCCLCWISVSLNGLCGMYVCILQLLSCKGKVLNNEVFLWLTMFHLSWEIWRQVLYLILLVHFFLILAFEKSHWTGISVV
jgi:hypothetical protein